MEFPLLPLVTEVEIRASSAEGSVAHPHGEHKGGCAAESMVHGTVTGSVERPLASVDMPGMRHIY